MTHPMIENRDRGVTLNKSLAWSALVAIVTLVWYGGYTISAINSATAQLATTVASIQAKQDRDSDAVASKVSANDARIRTLEQATARASAQFDALAQSLDEVKQEAMKTNDLLQQLLRGQIK